MSFLLDCIDVGVSVEADIDDVEQLRQDFYSPLVDGDVEYAFLESGLELDFD